jgi:hypothetical protein
MPTKHAFPSTALDHREQRTLSHDLIQIPNLPTTSKPIQENYLGHLLAECITADTSVDIEIITTLKHFLTIFTRKVDVEVNTLNMLIHVCGLVAGVVADFTSPGFLPRLIDCLYHLAFDDCIKG